MENNNIYQLEINNIATEKLATNLLDLIANISTTITLNKEDDNWQILAIFEEKPVAIDGTMLLLANSLNIPPLDYKIYELPEFDWVTENQKSFEPIRAGRFFIHSNYYKNKTRANDYNLEIEAANAFGTGTHGTTKGCLLLMGWLHKQGFAPKNIIDIGCGSGILALGAGKLWKDSNLILGSDIDLDSVKVSTNNARLNQIVPNVKFYLATGTKNSNIIKKAPYDLLIANILAKPLCLLALDFNHIVKKDSYLILSGLLIKQSNMVLSYYKSLSFRLVKTNHIGEWCSLLLLKC